MEPGLQATVCIESSVCMFLSRPVAHVHVYVASAKAVGTLLAPEAAFTALELLVPGVREGAFATEVAGATAHAWRSTSTNILFRSDLLNAV